MAGEVFEPKQSYEETFELCRRAILFADFQAANRRRNFPAARASLAALGEVPLTMADIEETPVSE